MTGGWDPEAFFTLHAELPREGPGGDGGCRLGGGGGGNAGRCAHPRRRLRAGRRYRRAPARGARGHVTAIDKHAPFIDQAQRAWGQNRPRQPARGRHDRALRPFDLIWCAGAVYFIGIERRLRAWRGRAAPGGAIAFSEPVLFHRHALGRGARLLGRRGDRGRHGGRSRRGWPRRGSRRSHAVLSDVAWESYFRPIADRIARLRPGADAGLAGRSTSMSPRWRAGARTGRRRGTSSSVVRPA
jgi:SAM-dependent methyltransferase